jgi:RecB family exonuclease
MKIKGLSATGIKDFLQCHLKVSFRYNREIISIKNDHAKVGISVHEALEQYTLRMLKRKCFPDVADYEFALSVFMNTATAEGLENMSFYSDGRRIVTEYIDRYDPAEKIVSVEGFFKLKTPEDVPIVGAIDKVVEINEDTIAIVDYKTARNALNTYELDTDIQLSMYDLAASIKWPQYKNRVLILDYVRIDKKVSSYRTEEQRQDFRDFLTSIWSLMNNLEEDEVKGRINTLCGWCDYKEYCPTYTQFLKNTIDKRTLTPLVDMEDSEFLDHWVQVSSKKSILENRQRELKMIANQRFMRGDEVAAAGQELYSTQASRTNYNVEDVVNIIPEEDLLEVLVVNKARLDRYVKNRPELKPSLSKVAQISYNAPVFKTRAIKVDKNGTAESDTFTDRETG